MEVDIIKAARECLILVLVNSFVTVKMHKDGSLYVSPYSDTSRYSNRSKSLCVRIIDGSITIDGEKTNPDGSYHHGELYRISLTDPRSFDDVAAWVSKQYFRVLYD